jgi:hypothetical protein
MKRELGPHLKCGNIKRSVGFQAIHFEDNRASYESTDYALKLTVSTLSVAATTTSKLYQELLWNWEIM